MTLKIEAGKFYRTRDGRKVGPMAMGKDGHATTFPWTDKGPQSSGKWSNEGEDGLTHLMGETDLDLIAEWQDHRPTQTVTTNGRHYDLTALETPFGLLPKAVQKALRAWPHGLEIYNSDETGLQGAWVRLVVAKIWDWHVVRAKPAPVEVRVRCNRYECDYGESFECGTCIKRPDGSIDWATWEKAE